MGLFSSSQKSKRETVPYAYARPGIDASILLARNALGNPLQYYPGQTYAPQTEGELQAIQNLYAGAGAYPGMHEGIYGPGLEGWQSAIGAPGAALGMNLQDVMNNPALQGIAESIQGMMTRNLNENILPGLTTQFMGYGGLGGTRQGVAEGLAVDRTQQAIGDSLASLYGNAWAQGLGAETDRYRAGLQAQAGALGRLPGMLEAGLSEYTRPAELLQQAGGLERTEEQLAIDEDMSRFQFNQMEPYTRAGLGLDLLMPPGQAFSTSRAEAKSSPSTFSQIGSALGAGSMLGGALFGQGGLFSGAMRGGSAPMMGAPMFNNPWTYGGYSQPGAYGGGGYGMYANPWTTYGYY